MYKSPVEVIYGQMQTQIDGDILRAIQSYGINVDKEELIRAMQYDRDQYEKGYADGKADAMAELVRCKDCKWYDADCEICVYLSEDGDTYDCGCDVNMKPDDFCSYGERRDNERKAD